MTRARDTANTQENIGGSVPPFVAGKNRIINSAFQIWQRGTSTATATSGSTGFLADRWQLWRSGFAAGATATRQVTNDTTNLPDIQYCARIQRDSGNTGTGVIALTNTFESVNSIPLAGKVVTLSFYARAGANFSSSGNGLTPIVVTGTGTDQNITGTYTGYANSVLTTVTLTTTWQRFTVTGTIPSTATEMVVQFNYTPVGTAGANDYYEVTGVQLEAGNVATPFTTATGTVQGELAACQRYYYQPTTGVYFNGQVVTTTTYYVMVYLPVAMRAAPTITNTSIVAGNFPATASSPAFTGTTSFANTRTASGTGGGGFADTYTASAEL